MQFVDAFDRVEIISLKDRKDRRADLTNQFLKINRNIDGGHIRFFDAIKPSDNGGFPSPGAHGCFKSHLEVLKSAKNDAVKRLLIIEDDLNFSSRIDRLSPLFYDLLDNNDWDFSYLGHKIESQNKNSGESLIPVVPEANIMCAHLIGISCKIIPELTSYLEEMILRPEGDSKGGPMHVDGAYCWFRREKKCNTVIASSQLGYQRSSRSDIANTEIYDRIPIVRNIVNLARKFK